MSLLPLNIPLEELENLLLDYLETQASGISEYDLIQHLRNQDLFRLEPGELLSSDSLIMFQIHFIVFHTLYRLRDRVRKLKSNDLDLNPVCIRLISFTRGDRSSVQGTANLMSHPNDIQLGFC